MKAIRLKEISGILNRMDKTALFSRAKLEAMLLVKDYVDGVRDVFIGSLTFRAFYKLIMVLDSGALKDAALNKFTNEHPRFMADVKSNKIKIWRKRSKTPDEIELDFCRETLNIYRQMGLLSKKNHEKFINADLHEIDGFLSTIALKTNSQKLRFAEIFVANHADNLNVVPPLLLARAHESLKMKVGSGIRGSEEDLLNNIVAQMDDISNQFATYENINNFRPSTQTQQLSNYVDMTNIASVYEGYRAVFEQRLTWFPKDIGNNVLANELQRNIKNIDAVMNEYDSYWGLNTSVIDENIIVNRYKNLKNIVQRFEPSDHVKKVLAQYVFLDKDNHPAQDDRLNKIIELVRHEVVLKNMVSRTESIDPSFCIGSDFDNALLLKLSDIANDKKIITDKAYNQAKLDCVNQTADFAGRLNSKFESFGENMKTDLLSKLFDPLQQIDERKNARFHDETNDTYKSKIEFFKRIFKTFASSCLTSAAITGIALGTATLAGISLSAGIAVVGVTTGIAMWYFRIKKWQKDQIAAHKECGIRELIRDRRMLTSLGATGIATIGMIFGAVGLTSVMTALGYTSIAIGGTTSSFQIFNDAKAKGLSDTLAASFAIGNLLAAATGGIAGRGIVKSFAGVNNSVTNNDSDTSVAKQETQTTPVESTDVPEQTNQPETQINYTQSGLDNAKRIAHMFYQDNLNQLQKHVEMVEQYNATHGTNIDPYRAAILRADAGGNVPSNYEIATDNNGATRFTNGNVKVFGADWLKSHPEFSVDDVKAMAKVFDGGVADETGMKAIERMELSGIVSEKNHVGSLSTPTQSVNGINTYSDGTPAVALEAEIPQKEIVVQPDATSVAEPVQKSTSGGMGMFGVFATKQRKGLKKLRERMGTFLDSVFFQKQR